MNFNICLIFLYFLSIFLLNIFGHKNYFYYISTDEGLIAHYQQLEHVWNGAESVNRNVKIIGFHAPIHFPNIHMIHMCDIFILPKNIECISETNKTIIEKNQCIYTGDYIHQPEQYGFPSTIEKSSNFDYSQVDCIAGPIKASSGVYPGPRHKSMMMEPYFHEKYLKMIPILRQVLNISKNMEYIVAHWRRGELSYDIL